MIVARITAVLRALRARWDAHWYAPVPADRLDAFRQALLYSLVLYLVARFTHATEWLTAIGFHPSVAADRTHAPILPLLPPGMTVAFAALTFTALALAIFTRSPRLRRPALAITLAAVIYVSLADPISAFTLNRLYVFTLLVLILTPAGATISAWPIRMLQWTLVTHYFASGLCKSLHGDWLQYSDVLWMQIQGLYMTDAAAWLVRTLPNWAFPVQQHLALGFELLAPLLLGVRRLRPLGIVTGIGLHLVVAITMYQLIYFSLQMIAFYTLFIDPGTLARWRRHKWIAPLYASQTPDARTSTV